VPQSRIALGLEYDGAAFNGWQTQPDRRSVQDALEYALCELAGEPISTICAGRTDAGVHAIDQIVHFDTAVERPLQAWVRGTNRFLPPTAVVRWARPMPDDFHARFCAFQRTYVYWLLNSPVRSPLSHHRARWVFRPLDERAMQDGAQRLVGTHDFTSFRAAECQANSPLRTLTRLDVRRHGRWIHVIASANAFLQHMVRNIVGALVEVGTGRQTATWISAVLAARDRALAAPTISPDGLYLSRVEYDARFEVPAPARMPNWFDEDPDQDLWVDP
jgi:tRNA pseudouridine38-40 synthase